MLSSITAAFHSIRRCWLRHWHGQYPLPVAFWLNFSALNVAIYLIQRGTRALVDSESALFFWLVLLEFVVFRLIVFPWQLVGLVRTCDRDLKDYGRSHWARTAQLVATLGVVIVLLDGFDVVRDGYTHLARGIPVAAIPSPSYELTLRDSDTIIHLQGDLDFGVTKELRRMLADHPAVTTVVLDSSGGPVYEARGLANLIRDEGLDTNSFEECSSACVTVFAGGHRRRLASRARLGFHRYRLDMAGPLPHIDEREELRKDFAFYESQGIDVRFLTTVFTTPPSEIWYPSRAELLHSGFVHEIAAPSPAGSGVP